MVGLERDWRVFVDLALGNLHGVEDAAAAMEDETVNLLDEADFRNVQHICGRQAGAQATAKQACGITTGEREPGDGVVVEGRNGNGLDPLEVAVLDDVVR